LRVLFLKYIYIRALKLNKIKIFQHIDRFIDFLEAFFKLFGSYVFLSFFELNRVDVWNVIKYMMLGGDDPNFSIFNFFAWKNLKKKTTKKVKF